MRFWGKGGSAAPFATSVRCPKCESVGATPQQDIVEPLTDGSELKVGRVYGCPRCSILWGVIAGSSFVLGDKRKVDQPLTPVNGTPNVPEEVRKRARASDGDMPWQRGR